MDTAAHLGLASRYNPNPFARLPRGFDLKAIRERMRQVPSVVEVHDLHLWSVADDDASLTAHVAIADGGGSESTRRAVVGMLESNSTFTVHRSKPKPSHAGTKRVCTGEGATRKRRRPTYLWFSGGVFT